jgi:hypothetical protein
VSKKVKSKAAAYAWSDAVMAQLNIWSHGEQLSSSEVVQVSRRLMDLYDGRPQSVEEACEDVAFAILSTAQDISAADNAWMLKQRRETVKVVLRILEKLDARLKAEIKKGE